MTNRREEIENIGDECERYIREGHTGVEATHARFIVSLISELKAAWELVRKYQAALEEISRIGIGICACNKKADRALAQGEGEAEVSQDNACSDVKLNPCPFCGHEFLNIVLRNKIYWVECDLCLATGPNHLNSTEQKAIEYWNGRAGVK